MTSFAQHPEQNGSALILVLAVLVSCVALIGGMQHRQYSRAQWIQQEHTELELRAALILGLQQGMDFWSEDEDLTLDHHGEEWAQPREWITSTGVRLRVELTDAQNRLNVNHLTLPVPEASIRTPGDILEDLFVLLEVPYEASAWREVEAYLTEEEPWLADPDVLRQIAPGVADWSMLDEHLVALPHPAGRFLPLNLNTVHPDVLQAMVGTTLRPWVDSVIQAREGEPIRSAASLIRFLPPQIQGVMTSLVGVETDYVELNAVATFNYTERTLQAWLHRDGEGNVEVIQCRW